MKNVISTLPKAGVYFGPVPFENANFVSGSFRILSRDVVKLLLDNPKGWTPRKLEDLALGEFLSKRGIRPIFIPSNNFDSVEQIDQAKIEVLADQLHFRLKSGTIDKRNDVKLMILLHKKILSNGVL